MEICWEIYLVLFTNIFVPPRMDLQQTRDHPANCFICLFVNIDIMQYSMRIVQNTRLRNKYQ